MQKMKRLENRLKTLRLKQSGKLLLIGLVGVLVLTSCSSLPPAPEINLYLHDEPRSQALCSNSFGKKCDKIPIKETDKFFMLRPRDWEKIENYIDLLACKAQGGCQSVSVKTSDVTKVSNFAYYDDLNDIKKRIEKIRVSLYSQRRALEVTK